MIKKFLYIIMFLSFTFLSFSTQAQYTNSYVRKKVQPAYFVPQKDIKKVEKLPMPRYSRGEEVSVKEARPVQEVRRPTYTTPNETKDIALVKPSEAEAQKENQKLKQNIINDDSSSDTPDYQKKYQEYIADLDYISKTGKSSNDTGISKDLSAMSSNERIVIDKQFNKQRNVKSKFEKTLNDSLNQ